MVMTSSADLVADARVSDAIPEFLAAHPPAGVAPMGG